MPTEFLTSLQRDEDLQKSVTTVSNQCVCVCVHTWVGGCVYVRMRGCVLVLSVCPVKAQ